MKSRSLLLPGVVAWALVALLAGAPSCSDDPADDGASDTGGDVHASDPLQPAPPDLAVRLEPGQVRAGVVDKAADLIGGPKAEGRVGDLKIYNAHVAFIIEGDRRTDGYRHFGGNVADADVVRPEGEPGNDHFGEYVPAWSLSIVDPAAVEVVDDGSTGGEAHIRVTGTTVPFPFAQTNRLVAPFGIASVTLDVVHDYTLGPDDVALKRTTSLTNSGPEPVVISFLLSYWNHGDGMFPWLPGAGIGGAAGQSVPYVGVSGRDLAYGLFAGDDDLQILFDYNSIGFLLEDPLTIPPGSSSVSDYWLLVTERGVDGLEAFRRGLAPEPEPVGAVSGTVSLPETVATEEAWVAAWQGDVPGDMAPVGPDGAFELALPPGAWEIEAYAHHHGPSGRVAAVVTEGGRVEPTLSVPASGRLTLITRDGAGQPVAARVTVRRTGDESPPGPPAAVDLSLTSPIPGDVVAVACVADGERTLVLPPGDYELVGSRGFTAELAEAQITVVAGETATATLDVVDVVDTVGFASADFHVHAWRSWDSGVPYATRARQAACEDLDVALVTEHTYAGGLAPEVADAGLEARVAGSSGQEVTHMAYGHFNVFPLPVDLDAINDGAVYPLDKTPPELFAAIRAAADATGEIVIQVNHPRDSTVGGYFAHVGLDASGAEVAVTRPDEWSDDWDAIEAFNKGCSGGNNMASVQDWFGLNDHGWKKTISSGSDTHEPDVPPGYPRNWVAVAPDDLRDGIAPFVAGVKARQLVVSCGPFVRLEALTDGDPVGLGGLVSVDDSGEATLRVQVQAPSWVVVDTVELLENGVVVATLDPDPALGPVTRVDETVTVAPAADSWYVVRVQGAGSLAPVSWDGQPYALTNPIDVDTDGDGAWTPTP